MAFRITRESTRQQAKADIVERLRKVDGSLAVVDFALLGTRNFHGSRSLSCRQYYNLLRELEADGVVEQSIGGQGNRTFGLRNLKNGRTSYRGQKEWY
jgi:hypothetical protein